VQALPARQRAGDWRAAATRRASLLRVLQVYFPDSGSDVEADASFRADRLQGYLLVASANEYIGADAQARSGRCTGAAIRALSAPGASLPGAKTSQTIFASVVKPMSTPNFFMLPS